MAALPPPTLGAIISSTMPETLVIIDGSHGEGGGQVLRTTLTLSALLGQPVRLEHVRAGRKNPGLAPQHLTAVRAVAQVCAAQVDGAALGSQTLTFTPQAPPQAGNYHFDVAQSAKGGSAGAISLILQAVLLPLTCANGRSKLTLKGGTHVPWSPPVHYLAGVYLPTLARRGIEASIELERWGFYPLGGGEVRAEIRGKRRTDQWAGLMIQAPGDLVRVRVLSAAANLPAHIRERQARRAVQRLEAAGIRRYKLEVVDAPSPGQGTVVFLLAEYDSVVAGFTGLGARGKPAEAVADEAVDAFLAHHRSGAAVDPHLADQLILPLALASQPSVFTTSQVTDHLLTNAWVVQQLLKVNVRISGDVGHTGQIDIEPA